MTNEEILSSAIRRPDHVVREAFAGETVMLNLNNGQYHGLNATAGQILNALESEQTVERAATRLSAGPESLDEVSRDVVGLCRDLLDRGLIELA